MQSSPRRPRFVRAREGLLPVPLADRRRASPVTGRPTSDRLPVHPGRAAAPGCRLAGDPRARSPSVDTGACPCEPAEGLLPASSHRICLKLIAAAPRRPGRPCRVSLLPQSDRALVISSISRPSVIGRFADPAGQDLQRSSHAKDGLEQGCGRHDPRPARRQPCASPTRGPGGPPRKERASLWPAAEPRAPGEGILDDLLGRGAILPAADIGALAWLEFLVDVEEVADLGPQVPGTSARSRMPS